MDQEAANHTIKKSKLNWADKKAMCEQWKASGKTKSQFCKEQGIPLQTFWAWCDRLWPCPKKQSQLAKVIVVDKKNTAKEELNLTTVEMILPNQAIIRFKLPNQEIAMFVQEMCHANSIVR